MSYRIDPMCQRHNGQQEEIPEARIVLVGCGGTGSFLAESLCRLLIGRRAELYLVDMDRVEAHNIGRQNFARQEIGGYKAQVLAERLACRYGRTIGYSVQPYDRHLHTRVFNYSPGRLNLLIGGVDTAEARREMAATLDAGSGGAWWLDLGNGRNSGQALLGNATRQEHLRGAFDRQSRVCRALPAPSLQRPDLLDAPPQPEPRPDCAEAVAQGEQGRIINQMVAAVAASFIEKVLEGNCRWMSAYFDLDDGLLRCLPAEPKFVARIVHLHPNAVVR